MTDPEFSPDGGSIALAGRLSDAEESRELLLVDVDGSNPRPLTTAAAQAATVTELTWRPDGTALAYVQTRPSTDGDRITEIWTLDPASGIAREVYEQAGVAISNLSWSPASDALLFGDRPASAGEYSGRVVRELDLTSGDVTTRATEALYPVYASSGGGDLLYLEDRGDDESGPGVVLMRQGADGQLMSRSIPLDAVAVNDVSLAACALD